MSTKTRPPLRHRPSLELFEARLCLSTLGGSPHHVVHHAPIHAVHHAPVHVVQRAPYAGPQHHAAPHPRPHRGIYLPMPAASGASLVSVAPLVYTPPVVAIPTPPPTISNPTTYPVTVSVPQAPATWSPQPSPSIASVAPAPVVYTSAPILPAASTPPAAVVPSTPVLTPPYAQTGTFNMRVLAYAEAEIGRQVGDGQCGTLAIGALNDAGAMSNFDRSNPNGDFVWGQLATTLTTQSHDLSPIRPGDVIQFRNATTVSHDGNATSWQTADHHTAIVESVNGTTITVLNQNVNGQLTVQRGTWNVADLTGGTMWVYHPITA